MLARVLRVTAETRKSGQIVRNNRIATYFIPFSSKPGRRHIGQAKNSLLVRIADAGKHQSISRGDTLDFCLGDRHSDGICMAKNMLALKQEGYAQLI